MYHVGNSSPPSALCGRPPQPRWRRAAPGGRTVFCRRRVAVARDEHAACRPRSAYALPSRAGGGPRRAAAPCAAAGASRSRETSTPRAVRAPHTPPPQPHWRRASAADSPHPGPRGGSPRTRSCSPAPRAVRLCALFCHARGPAPPAHPTSHSVTVVRSCRARPGESHPRAVGIPV